MIYYGRLDPSALRTRKGQGVPASGFELALGPALLRKRAGRSELRNQPRAQCLELRKVIVMKKCVGVNPVPERTGRGATAINKIACALADIDPLHHQLWRFHLRTHQPLVCSRAFFFCSKATLQPSQSILL